jgi:Domain of unknown function (DUF4276)
MQLEFLVEDRSIEEALKNLVPKIVSVEIRIHPFQGKQDLIKKLPVRLKGYKKYIDESYRIVVVIDRDDENCHELKNKLEKIAQDAGLLTRSTASIQDNYQVINRIAIEELEAWFFGDVEAIKSAYQKISLNIAHQERYRAPDAITGGTAEALEKILKDKKYYTRMPKPEVARNISIHMDPERNTSKSFQVFRDALKDLEK